MNRECNDGMNPFKDDSSLILQVEENEKACGFFKLKRTKRIREYIKKHPKLYAQQ